VKKVVQTLESGFAVEMCNDEFSLTYALEATDSGPWLQARSPQCIISHERHCGYLDIFSFIQAWDWSWLALSTDVEWWRQCHPSVYLVADHRLRLARRQSRLKIPRHEWAYA